jgi:tetratricopeptide (TPR) repeat protein
MVLTTRRYLLRGTLRGSIMTRATLRLAATTLATLLLGIQPVARAAGTAAENYASAAAVGGALVRAFNQRDEQLAGTLIDINALALRAGKSMSPDPRQQELLTRSAASLTPHKMLQSYFKILDATHGSVKLMRVGQRGAQTVALTRFDVGTKGYDYLEFVLERDGTGQYRAVDWYQLSRGELVSGTAGAIGRLLIDPDPDLIHALFGVVQIDEHLLQNLKDIGARQRAGDYAGALAAMEQLPPAIADSRTILMMRVTAAALAGRGESYHSTLAVLAAKYGDDPSAAFMLIDHYLHVGQFDQALRALAFIERRVGADGVTNMLKANINLRSGNYEQAVTFAQRSIRIEPDLKEGYYSLALGYVGLQQYPRAVETYRTLASRFSVRFERQKFVGAPVYAGLVQSAAFAQWLPN